MCHSARARVMCACARQSARPPGPAPSSPARGLSPPLSAASGLFLILYYISIFIYIVSIIVCLRLQAMQAMQCAYCLLQQLIALAGVYS